MKECCARYLSEQFGGDADVMNEIYGEYVSSIREKLTEADAALVSGGWQQLDRVAHTIKGNAFASGDEEMAETAISLRSASQLQDGGQVAELIARLKELEKTL